MSTDLSRKDNGRHFYLSTFSNVDRINVEIEKYQLIKMSTVTKAIEMNSNELIFLIETKSTHQ